MKKEFLIVTILFTLVTLGVLGFLYTQKKNTEVFPEPGSISSSSPTPVISLPPKEVQQKVITQDENVHKPLTLTVISPVDKSTVTNATLTVKGKTAPLAEVFVNESEGIADADGNFSLSIVLDEGDNPVIVMVNDADGNVAEKDMNITYDAGQ